MKYNERAVEGLIDALCTALKRHSLTEQQLSHAMRLAFEHGRIDGGLDVAQKAIAQEIHNVELRG